MAYLLRLCASPRLLHWAHAVDEAELHRGCEGQKKNLHTHTHTHPHSHPHAHTGTPMPRRVRRCSPPAHPHHPLPNTGGRGFDAPPSQPPRPIPRDRCLQEVEDPTYPSNPHIDTDTHTHPHAHTLTHSPRHAHAQDVSAAALPPHIPTTLFQTAEGEALMLLRLNLLAQFRETDAYKNWKLRAGSLSSSVCSQRRSVWCYTPGASCIRSSSPALKMALGAGGKES